MKKNKKTVLKGFNYTQCDDFACYLEEMAAKGWHFKEWGTGLVFEKGEPEQAVYAVDVFIDGSEYDVRPDVHTLNFADYCEAAGWKLVDARRKFCVFKRIREDAADILTPRERVNNAAKAFSREVWQQFAVAAVLTVMMLLNFVLKPNYITLLFSNVMLYCMAVYAALILSAVTKLVWFYMWKHHARKRADAGEYRVLTNRVSGAFAELSWIVLIMFCLAIAVSGEFAQLIWLLVLLLIMFGFAWFIAKFRPDAETNSMIQMGMVILLFLLYAGMAVVMLVSQNEDSVLSKVEETPICYSDLGIDAGEVINSYSEERVSVLGNMYDCSLYYAQDSLDLTVFHTQHTWILDRLWNDYLSVFNNASATQCTADWGAMQAYRNGIGIYYVRYPDTILILDLEEDIYLSGEQIKTVLDRLELR